MNLHDLMGTAVADLPDLPDQLDEVGRIHHRRSTVKRATAIAASTVLVVGAGTLTIASPWGGRHGPTAVVAAGPAAFPQQLIDLLQPIWPKSGETITWAPSAESEVNDDPTAPAAMRYLVYRVTSATGSYLLAFDFGPDTQPSVGPGTPEPSVSCPPPECVGEENWLVGADLSPFAPGSATRSVSGGVSTVATPSPNVAVDVSTPTGHLVVQDNVAVLVAMEIYEKTDLTVPELNALGASAAMHELYRDAIADGLLYTDIFPPVASPTPPAETPGN
jgi:hypothetical protein